MGCTLGSFCFYFRRVTWPISDAGVAKTFRASILLHLLLMVVCACSADRQEVQLCRSRKQKLCVVLERDRNSAQPTILTRVYSQGLKGALIFALLSGKMMSQGGADAGSQAGRQHAGAALSFEELILWLSS